LLSGGIEDYAQRFARLRTNKNRKVWSEVTAHQAPHKPLLLLCVLDLFDSGEIFSNLIEITEDLAKLFGRYWERVLPFGRPGILVLPFFHLRGDGFWHLIPSHEGARLGSQIAYLSRLREEILGARLDDGLYDLMRSEENRDRLRSVLIDAYFSPEMRRPVFVQGAINRGAFFYSEELLKRPEDRGSKRRCPTRRLTIPPSATKASGGPSSPLTSIAAPCAASACARWTDARRSRRRT
jgi:putative restriction endonuclease